MAFFSMYLRFRILKGIFSCSLNLILLLAAVLSIFVMQNSWIRFYWWDYWFLKVNICQSVIVLVISSSVGAFSTCVNDKTYLTELYPQRVGKDRRVSKSYHLSQSYTTQFYLVKVFLFFVCFCNCHLLFLFLILKIKIILSTLSI